MATFFLSCNTCKLASGLLQPDPPLTDCVRDRPRSTTICALAVVLCSTRAWPIIGSDREKASCRLLVSIAAMPMHERSSGSGFQRKREGERRCVLVLEYHHTAFPFRSGQRTEADKSLWAISAMPWLSCSCMRVEPLEMAQPMRRPSQALSEPSNRPKRRATIA